MRSAFLIGGFCLVCGGIGLAMGYVAGRISGYHVGARATADSLLVVTRKQAIIAAKSDSIIALLQRQSAARLDTITALRREHSARVYPKRRAQLDSLTSPLTATPEQVRAWLKQ